MLHALATLGAVLLSFTGVSFLVMAAFLFGEAAKPGHEDRDAEVLFGVVCLVAGSSMVTTAIAVLHGLQ